MEIFRMDPGQDLLVIIAKLGPSKYFSIAHHIYHSINTDESLRIHLLTLSKGERHPLTSEPCIVIHGLGHNPLQEMFIDICHDFLSILVGGGAMLWNWKTGQVLMVVLLSLPRSLSNEHLYSTSSAARSLLWYFSMRDIFL